MVGLVGCGGGPERRAARAVEVHPAWIEAGLSTEMADLAAGAMPSVVRVRNETQLFKSAGDYGVGLWESLLGVLNPHPYWEWPYRVLNFPVYLVVGMFDLREGYGTGFFVGEGLVLTNAHVVDNTAALTCEFTDGRRTSAEVVGLDEERDLALLRLGSVEGEWPPALRMRRAETRPGELVLGVGFPGREVLLHPVLKYPLTDERRGVPNPTLTFGVVSAVDVELGNASTAYMQTDAAINPGNSGGPVLTLDGEVAGVATLTALGKENEGYAVPSETVRSVFAEELGEPEVDVEEPSGE